MRSRRKVSRFSINFVWAAAFAAGIAPAANTTTTLTPSGNNPYTLTATVSTTGLPLITGSVSFKDATNNSILNTASLSAPTVVQSFLPTVFYPGGVVGNTPVPGDFNGDGKVDLAVANSDNTITVLLGKGDGTFPQQVTTPIGSLPVRIAGGDFNRDGKPDLVALDNRAQTLTVLLGAGDGTFNPTLSRATGLVDPFMRTADLNNDGISDVVVVPAAVGEPVRVFLGQSDGTLGEPIPYDTPSTNQFVIGDYDGDGKVDLAMRVSVIDAPRGVLVGKGKGDGKFETAVPYTVATTASGIAIAPFLLGQGDVNGDGRLDLIAPTTRGLAVLLNNGNGTFSSTLDRNSARSGGDSLVIADFNSDGKLDLLLNAATWILQLGNGDGTFQPPPSFNSDALGTSLIASDLNGDGAPDLVGAPNLTVDPTVAVTLNNLVQTATATLSNAMIIGTGPHDVSAIYTGDPSHAQSSSTIQLAALRVPTTLQLTSNATSVPFRTGVTLTATLTPNAAQNLKTGGLVTFSLAGSATPLGTAALNAQGAATLTNVLLPLGDSSVTAQYAGDTNFAPANSAPLAITTTTSLVPANGSSCNGAYTGVFNGNIVVSPGQYCEFLGGTVRGNLVSTGGIIVLSNATVTGNLQISGGRADSAGAQYMICASTVRGNVAVQNAGLPVVIGSGNFRCGSSTIGGNLELQNNAASAPLTMIGSVVNGNMEAQNNSGALQVTQSTISNNLQLQNNRGGLTVLLNIVGRNMEIQNNAPTAIVNNNQITGNLQCSSNTGITGAGNTAKQKQGQCAAF